MGTLVENEVFFARRDRAGQVGTMPGNARLDVLGVLQHAIVQGGGDRYDIFQDKPDREAFLLRVHEKVGECFAALGRLCTMLHTSVRAVIARAAQRRAEPLR